MFNTFFVFLFMKHPFLLGFFVDSTAFGFALCKTSRLLKA